MTVNACWTLEKCISPYSVDRVEMTVEDDGDEYSIVDRQIQLLWSFEELKSAVVSEGFKIESVYDVRHNEISLSTAEIHRPGKFYILLCKGDGV